MDLEQLLTAMDRAAANLDKLERVWERSRPFLPTGPARGSDPEYDDLARAWKDLLAGLPEIDEWTITEELPDADALGQAYIDYFEISEPPFNLQEEAEQPTRDLAEYRFRLNRARRRAARQRLQELCEAIDMALPRLLDGVPRTSQDKLDSEGVAEVRAALDEIERLMGDTAQRRGRWGEMHRHMYFGQGHDWHDICEFDWPTVRPDVEAGALADSDPLPVPNIDLGKAAAGHLTGVATLALPWERLDDEGFERLLYNLLLSFPEHQNVQWLTNTKAADKGRDLSMERVISDGTGGVRTERVIVQAKHWQKSVNAPDVGNTLTLIKLWQPPVVRVLIMATSGTFSESAVAWVEQHNEKGEAPHIEMWGRARLETLLAQKPHLAAAHGLR